MRRKLRCVFYNLIIHNKYFPLLYEERKKERKKERRGSVLIKDEQYPHQICIQQIYLKIFNKLAK